jgi:hypothetical protein
MLAPVSMPRCGPGAGVSTIPVKDVLARIRYVPYATMTRNTGTTTLAVFEIQRTPRVAITVTSTPLTAAAAGKLIRPCMKRRIASAQIEFCTPNQAVQPITIARLIRHEPYRPSPLHRESIPEGKPSHAPATPINTLTMSSNAVPRQVAANACQKVIP